MKHEFFASRNKAQGISESPIWDDIYRQAFPGFHAQVPHPSGEHWGQYAGIDRTIVLSSGANITLDEKLRYAPYQDVLLEYWAVKEKGVPGWVCLDLACDFISYANLPLGVCYLLPFPLLRRAWQNHGEDWKKQYRIVTAKNQGYTSESVAVPIKELVIALVGAMRLTFEPIDIKKVS